MPIVSVFDAETQQEIEREMTTGELKVWSAPAVERTLAEKLQDIGLSIPDLKAELGL